MAGIQARRWRLSDRNTLRDLKQLFNTLDPAPFHQNDLDPAAEEYIVSAVREIGSQPSRLALRVLESAGLRSTT